MLCGMSTEHTGRVAVITGASSERIQALADELGDGATEILVRPAQA
jgi:NAD(P)-dependent dehydrogenase (short-subunit alcohol dehydrogenase family)